MGKPALVPLSGVLNLCSTLFWTFFFSNGVKRNGIGTDSKIFLRFEMHDKKWCLEMIVEKWAFSWSSTCFEAVKSAEEKGY